jgi:hypothetical protein
MPRDTATIVTFLADDDERRQRRVIYPNIAGLGPEARSAAYWRCVAAFFATSKRANVQAKHIFYTNRIPGNSPTSQEVLSFIGGLGVEVRELPFRHYRNPANLCSRFMNIFYRLEVLRDLANALGDELFVVLDSDCVWTRSIQEFVARFGDGELHAIEIFKQSDPDVPVHLGIRKRDLAAAFKRVDPEFSVDCPKWYGGELFAGSTDALFRFITRFDDVYRRFVTHSGLHDIELGGVKWLDTDEYTNSLVMNSMDVSDEPGFVHRVWTEADGNPDANHLSVPVVHLLAEKHRGFRALYPYCIDRNSEFWAIPLPDIPAFLGEFFGIPRRIRFHKLTPLERLKKSAKRLLGRA